MRLGLSLQIPKQGISKAVFAVGTQPLDGLENPAVPGLVLSRIHINLLNPDMHQIILLAAALQPPDVLVEPFFEIDLDARLVTLCLLDTVPVVGGRAKVNDAMLTQRPGHVRSKIIRETAQLRLVLDVHVPTITGLSTLALDAADDCAGLLLILGSRVIAHIALLYGYLVPLAPAPDINIPHGNHVKVRPPHRTQAALGKAATMEHHAAPMIATGVATAVNALAAFGLAPAKLATPIGMLEPDAGAIGSIELAPRAVAAEVSQDIDILAPQLDPAGPVKGELAVLSIARHHNMVERPACLETERARMAGHHEPPEGGCGAYRELPDAVSKTRGAVNLVAPQAGVAGDAAIGMQVAVRLTIASAPSEWKNAPEGACHPTGTCPCNRRYGYG